jgi:hypothetical protein
LCFLSHARVSTLHIHNSNLEDCFRLGRNYTLAVTETVRRSALLHLTPREYPARDKYVKRNYSSSWYLDRAALAPYRISATAARRCPERLTRDSYRAEGVAKPGEASFALISLVRKARRISVARGRRADGGKSASLSASKCSDELAFAPHILRLPVIAQADESVLPQVIG